MYPDRTAPLCPQAAPAGTRSSPADLFSGLDRDRIDTLIPAPDDDPWTPRRPRVAEWVNCTPPEANGENGVRRGARPFDLAQVVEVREDGCVVRPWQRSRLDFGASYFAPWLCIVARCQVSRYSLTGESA